MKSPNIATAAGTSQDAGVWAQHVYAACPRRGRLALATLAALGWVARTVRPWEALVMVVGIVGIYATNTALHGDARYGLSFVLVASASIAFRMERSSRHG